jgi:hypothetical protein
MSFSGLRLWSCSFEYFSVSELAPAIDKNGAKRSFALRVGRGGAACSAPWNKT